MLMDRVLEMHIVAQNPAPPPPPSAMTTATPTQYAPPAKILTKVSFALKTARQVTTKRGYLTTPVKLALSESITIYGISMSANSGPIV